MAFKFPEIVSITKNFRIKVDVIKESDVPKTVEMVQELSQEIAVDEFPNEESVHRMIKSGTFFTLEDADTHSPIGFYLLCGTPFVRSLRPRCHAQYVCLKREFRGGAVALKLFHFLKPFVLANGYEGCMTRISMDNTKWLSRTQGMATAFPLLIPGGVNTSNGVTNDIVTFSKYDKRDIEKTIFPNMSPEDKAYCLSVHQDSSYIPSQRPRMEVEIPERKHTFTCGLETVIKIPFEEEEKEIEKLTLEAANDGQGFGEDELLPDGRLGKRMLHKYVMLVVKTPGGDTVCGGIMGPSILCRSASTDKMSLNIVVNKKYRNKKIGQEFVEICLQEMQKLGYTAVLTDILSTDVPHILPLVSKLGFTVIGSLPSCTRVKGHGWTDSLVIQKKLKTSKL